MISKTCRHRFQWASERKLKMFHSPKLQPSLIYKYLSFLKNKSYQRDGSISIHVQEKNIKALITFLKLPFLTDRGKKSNQHHFSKTVFNNYLQYSIIERITRYDKHSILPLYGQERSFLFRFVLNKELCVIHEQDSVELTYFYLRK